LVTRLQHQGYKARFTKSGVMYKVVVGGLSQRHEAISLQKKLAANLQLHGFIVKTGVG
jgi:cell division septation protein DedD